jgi:hypothetical protein
MGGSLQSENRAQQGNTEEEKVYTIAETAISLDDSLQVLRRRFDCGHCAWGEPVKIPS